MKENSYLIGIGGGTGSGKSTLARELQRQLYEQGAVLISMDDYYRDQTSVSPEERTKVNYDHPESLDVKLLAKHLTSLRDGNKIDKPLYDFTEHTRKKETEELTPVKWILVEGILTLYYKELLQLFQYCIFVDAPADLRFIRRLSRDMVERGRSLDSVIQQYLKTVRPMHQEFVEPSKKKADHVVSGEDSFVANVAFLLSKISSRLGETIESKPVEVPIE